MSNNAAGVDKAAAEESNGQASEALGKFQGAESAYMSNVNSKLAAGNPFETKDYLTKQNLLTSGAMNAEHTAETQALGDTVARTGTNTAATANTLAAGKRDAARDLTTYNAGRDTANAHAWEGEQEGLRRDQLAGANSEASIFATGKGAQTSDLRAYTDADMANQRMWMDLAKAGIGAAGTMATAGMA